MAKKFVTEAGSRVADQCLQLHGGYGYLADYGIEKIVRDLRVHQILEGTNEIMRLIVARNALSFAMVGAIDAALRAWARVRRWRWCCSTGWARGRSAPGDVAAIYRLARRGDFAGARAFWGGDRMDALLARYGKPFVALLHGFVMGGGVGLGCHLAHRIVGESARLAMPDCAIGLIPDVGGGHFWPAPRGGLASGWG